MPLGKTPFARRFGMVADRFGISWMVISRRRWRSAAAGTESGRAPLAPPP
jgi:predicted 3-demethylubiquinone-9 3-methyltransferase (glyoxalase superfamily)